MPKLIFQDIPVYRLSRESYEKAMDSYVAKNLKDMTSVDMKDNPPLPHSSPFEQYLRRTYGGPWEYNEVIGHIRLYFYGLQIRGEYWQISQKRISKTRKKIFGPNHYKLTPEISVKNSYSNEQIWESILQYIHQCREKLRGRYIDSSRIEALGQFVDWSAFLKSLRK